VAATKTKTADTGAAEGGAVAASSETPGGMGNGGGGEEGIIEPLVRDVFRTLSEKNASVECSVRCCVVEAFGNNRVLRDLLYGPSRVRIQHPGGKLVRCSAVSCLSPEDVLRIVRKGRSVRTASAASALADETDGGDDPASQSAIRDSARSTFIVQLVLEQYDHRAQESRESRLLIVDLAASELSLLDKEELQQQQQSNEPEERNPDVVSRTLDPLRRYVREEITRQQQGGSTISKSLSENDPILLQMLSSSFGGSAYTSVILHVSPSELESKVSLNTLKLGAECRKIVNHPTPLVHHRWQDCHARLREVKENRDRLEELTIAFANECYKSRSKISNLGLIRVVDDIQQKISSGSMLQQQPRIEFRVETKEEHEVRMEKMKMRSALRQAEKDRAEAMANLAHVENDLEQTVAQLNRYKKMVEERDKHLKGLSVDIPALKQRNEELDHNLRTSLFRESEAVVFLRQFRRFYFRLLKQNEAQGNGDVDSVIRGIPGAPDLSQLVDLDRLMVESGLLEENEIGVDAAIKKIRPSQAAMKKSSDQAEQEQSKVNEDNEGTSGSSDVGLLTKGALISVVKRLEDGELTEARQRLYETPSGRCIDMREQALERDLLQLSNKCAELQTQIREEKDKVAAVQGGFLGANKAKAAEEIASLKALLQRKDKDLKAVIWKMNEMHLSGKIEREKFQGREPHLVFLEQSLAKTEGAKRQLIEDGVSRENSLHEEIVCLREELDRVKPQLHSDVDSAKSPLETRLIVSFSPAATDESPERRTSLGNGDGWAALYFNQPRADVSNTGTQTDPIELVDAVISERVNLSEPKREVQRLPSHISPDDFLFMSEDESDTGVDQQEEESPSAEAIVPETTDSVREHPPALSVLNEHSKSTAESQTKIESQGAPPSMLNSWNFLSAKRPSLTESAPVPQPPASPSKLSQTAAQLQPKLSQSMDHQQPTTIDVLPDEASVAILDKTPSGVVQEETSMSVGSVPSASSIMARLRAKAVDSGDQSGVPEFMNMFKKIGGRNQNENVIETQGAVAPREMTRTAFGETLKHHDPKNIDPAAHYSSTPQKWTPRKKKGDDSDSSDDSFAARFIGGRSAHGTSGDTDDSESNRGSGNESKKAKEEEKDSGDESDDSESLQSKTLDKLIEKDQPQKDREVKFAETSDSVIGVASFIDNTSYPSLQPERSPWSDSESSVSSNERKAAATKPAQLKAKNDSESDDSSDDDSESSPPKKVPAVVRPPPPKPKDDSDSDSSDEDEPPKKPIVTTAPPPSPPKPKDDSSDSDSSDEDEPPKKPSEVAAAPAPPKPKNDSSDSGSSEEDEIVKKPVAVSAPPPPKTKDDSDSDDDSSDEDEPPKNPGVATVPSPPKPQEDSGSDEDSSEDDETPKKPDVVAKPPPKPKEESDSEEESSDEEDEPPRKPVAASKPPPKPRADSDSEEDSSDEEVKTISKEAASKNDSESDADSSGEEEEPPKKPAVASKPPANDSESEDESSEEEPPKGPAPKDESESEEESSEEEDKPSKKVPAAPAARDSDLSDEEEEETDEEDENSKQGEEVSVATKPTANTAPAQNGLGTEAPDYFASVREKRTVDPSLQDAFGADPFGQGSESDADESAFSGGKPAGFQPKRSAPDFGSNVTPSLSQAANVLGGVGKQGKKKEMKAKFVIKGGKLVKADDGDGADGGDAKKEKASAAQPKTKFVIKGGKLVKDDSAIQTSLSMLDQGEPTQAERRNSLDSKMGDEADAEGRESRRAGMTSPKGKKGKSKKDKGDKDGGGFFVIRDGQLIKSPNSSKSKAKVAKPAFTIVNGKLVKNDLKSSPKKSKGDGKTDKGKKKKKKEKG